MDEKQLQELMDMLEKQKSEQPKQGIGRLIQGSEMLYKPKLDAQGQPIKEKPVPIPAYKPQYDEEGNEYINVQNAILRPDGDYSQDQRKMILNKPNITQDRIQRQAPLKDIQRMFQNPEETPRLNQGQVPDDEQMKMLQELLKDQGFRRMMGEPGE